MGLEILRAGLQSTVQDKGRFGYAHLGVSASGAADKFSLRIGNMLVGNPNQTAGIEMTIIGDKYRFKSCLLYTSPSPRDYAASRMPSSA